MADRPDDLHDELTKLLAVLLLAEDKDESDSTGKNVGNLENEGKDEVTDNDEDFALATPEDGKEKGFSLTDDLQVFMPSKSITTAVLLFIVLGYGPSVLCDVIVVFYPAYRSFEALEEANKIKAMYWLKYWIVFGIFRTVERIGDSLFWWLPGYYFLKFVFLVCCFAPVDKNGSVIIYENYIRPAFMNNAETVDSVLKTVRSYTTHSTVG